MKKSSSPNSKTVAEALGVSVSTISRVLTRPDLVNENTRRRILLGIERLGYRPNLAARDLRRGKTGTILVIVPVLRSLFFLEVLRGVEAAADELGFSALLANTRTELEREIAYLDLLTSNRADGVILLTGRLPPGSAKWARSQPLVLAGEPVLNSNLPTVGVDHEGGAEEAVRHLINLGHKRVGLITGPEQVLSAGWRTSGYRKALRSARIPLDNSLIQPGAYTIESGTNAMHALLHQRNPPTAVFATSDLMAIGAVRALKAVGLRVPADISVVGFDNEELAEIHDPPLTTVHFPRYEVGYQAMMMLMDVMSKKRSARSATLPTQLIVRASSARPRID
jgi:LacI family repressor for deo operon, udp, cdd, tsx, nupC, and nupG